MTGTLLVIATPLGNLEDLSPRAQAALASADRIACEDTRRTGRMLARLGIETAMISCHGFDERSRLQPLLALLGEGRTIALVSDAGTPGISDPGAMLVEAAREAGHLVSPLPGPSAASALLSICGFSADRYAFDGFLPHRAGERRKRLREIAADPRAVVFFETPHRILDALRDIDAVLGARRLVLGRELTKLHETVYCGTAAEILPRLGAQPKGEFVGAFAPGDGGAAVDPRAEGVRAAWRETLAETGGDRRAALKKTAKSLGMKRAELFRLLAELGESPGD